NPDLWKYIKFTFFITYIFSSFIIANFALHIIKKIINFAFKIIKYLFNKLKSIFIIFNIKKIIYFLLFIIYKINNKINHQKLFYNKNHFNTTIFKNVPSNKSINFQEFIKYKNNKSQIPTLNLYI